MDSKKKKTMSMDDRANDIKKFLNIDGLSHLITLFTSFVTNYAAPKNHNHDNVYAKTAHTHSTAQVTGLDSALAGKADKSHTHDDRYYTEGEVDSKLAGKAPSSHTHTIGNITNLQSSLDGKAAASHGHSAATTSAAGFMAAADKSKLDGIAAGANKTIVDSSLSSTSVNPVQNKVVNSALAGKASTSHTHTIAQVSGLDAALAGKAPSGHTHTITQVTNLQTELDKKQDKTHPVTTSGTGSAYTATVPHIKALTAGMKFTMIPHVVSAAVSPTLDVNGLGAKPIRQRLSNGTASTATGATANWLAAGKPVNVMYDGAFWVVDFVRPNMTSAYGTLPVANGGTGCTNSSDAASHLIDSLAVGATTATDNDYLICQVPNSGTAHKRPMSVVWNWVKAKCDSIYQPKGSYAASSHTHNSIKDIGDGRDITFNYSADGAQDATWFAVWNGSELKSMSKQQMKTSLGISSSGVNLGKLMYPVGAVYISWSSTSPASLFGGSWVAITGRFPYFNAGTSTGGSNSHTLSINELAKHSHSIFPDGNPGFWNYGTDWGGGYAWSAYSKPSYKIGEVNLGSRGGNAAHNNMPSYQTLYAWRRTA